jgi:pterin-4a-carbinolamine dehydratase
MSGSLTKIMHDYLNEGKGDFRPRVITEMFFTPTASGCPELPLQPVDLSQWEVVSDPNRFKREFEFNTFPEFKVFLDEVLEHQEEVDHHGKISLDGLNILVEVYTHDVNDITELDQEYVRALDQIHRDVQDYFLTDKNDDNGWG